MTRERILLILGIWIAVLPYLGFPHSWKSVLFTLSGLAVGYVSYLMYRNSRKKDHVVFDSFSENKDFSDNSVQE